LKALNWVYYTLEIWAANNLNIHVSQASGDVDLYLHRDTIPDFVTYDYADFSTNPTFDLAIVDPILGTWYLGFHAFMDTSFNFTVAEQRSCPMNCSNHGNCVGSYCICNSAYTGLTCEEGRNPLVSGISQHGYVDANYWNYYKFIANSGNGFLIRVTNPSSSNCDVYVMNNAKPTKFIYQYLNVTLLPVAELLVSNPGFDTWWIGIYGTTSCHYDIVVESSQVVSICGSCEHGRCEGDFCVCNPGWFGAECDILPEVLSNGHRSNVQSIQNGKWKYYEISATNTSQLTVVLNEKATQGLIWLYTSKENFPTLTSHEAADSNSISSTHRISLEFIQPKSTRFVIGVYGSPFILDQNPEFSVVAFFPPF
jgi:hypothetical protein